MKCPLCFNDSKEIKRFESAKIDGSLLYRDIIILQCEKCGHVFNYLTEQDKKNLSEYYKIEYIESEYKIQQSWMYSKSWPLLDKIEFNNSLEHWWNPLKAISNIQKSLEPKGILRLNVPNRLAYDSNPRDELYFWLIKEHVQHFDKQTVISLFKQCDFELQEFESKYIPILNKKLWMPMLEFIFQLKDAPINGTYCYGAGREYLYEQPECDALIDDTPSKQGKTINGKRIYSIDLVRRLSGDSTIIITSWYHKAEMRQKLLDLEYKGSIL